MKRLPPMVVAVALVGCWRGSPAAPVSGPLAPRRAPEACREARDVIRVTACRRNDGLQWLIENRGETPIWVFAGMPSMQNGAPDVANVLVHGEHGHLVLLKILPAGLGDTEFVELVELAPGAELFGLVPLGRQIVNHTRTLRLTSPGARGPIADVAFEVGFAVPSARDLPIVHHDRRWLRTLHAPQVRVRTAPVPW